MISYLDAVQQYYKIKFSRRGKENYIHKVIARFTQAFRVDAVIVWIVLSLTTCVYIEDFEENSLIILLGVLIAMGMVLIKRYFINRRYGHKPHNLNIYQREKPSNLRPAHVRMLLNDGLVDRVSLVATIMDLVDRGYLETERSEAERLNFENFMLIRTEKDDSDLLKYEKFLMDWFFEKYAKNSVITMKNLNAFLNKNMMEETTVMLFEEWVALVNLSYPVKQLYKECIKENLIKTIIYVIFAVIDIMIISGEVQIPGVLGIICIYCIGAGLFTTPKYMLNQVGTEERDAWLDLKKYLNDFSNMKEKTIENIELWGFYLTYAIALDIYTVTQYEFLKFINWYWPDRLSIAKNDNEFKIMKQFDANVSDEIINKEIENEMKIYNFKTFY